MGALALAVFGALPIPRRDALLLGFILELLRRGFSDEDVKKTLGENFLRAMGAAEAYAASTKTTLSGDGSTRSITANSER